MSAQWCASAPVTERCDVAAMAWLASMRARGMRRRRCSEQPESHREESTRSMLEQQVSTRPDVAPNSDDPRRIDRSMDALQYGIAFLAIIVAVLLASIR
jgi:hypothetical protein